MSLFTHALAQIQLPSNYGSYSADWYVESRKKSHAAGPVTDQTAKRRAAAQRNREAVFQAAISAPGSHQADIMRATGLSISCVRFHLANLVQTQRLTARGAKSKYYPGTTIAP